MSNSLGNKVAVAALVLFGGIAVRAHAGEVVLRALTALPVQTDYSKSFKTFIDRVNAEGKGVVQIHLVGGPEVTPGASQAEAVKHGIIDMVYGPATYWLGLVPEGDAFIGSNISVDEARRDGALKAMDSIYRRKLDSHLLGWFDTGINFHIYTVKKPPRDADGKVDFKGMKIRSNPVYLEFFKKLGIINIAMPAPSVYTALERGLVQGIGWPTVGITDFGWQRFLRYRIDPGFFQIDTIALVNLDKWNALPAKAREILTAAATEHEDASYRHFQSVQARLGKELRKAGIRGITLPQPQREEFSKLANATVWQHLAQRSPQDAAKLKALFYK